jgi:plastocyanin
MIPLSRSRIRLGTTAVMSSAALLAGCGGGSPDTTDASAAQDIGHVRQVEIEGSEYAFSGIPPEGHPGNYEIDFVNTGEESHELSFVRLKAGTTARSVIDAQEAGEDPATLVEEFLGSTGPVAPGASSTVTVTFEDGSSYGYACLLPAADGEPHAAHGMLGEMHATTSVG